MICRIFRESRNGLRPDPGDPDIPGSNERNNEESNDHT